jgi:hypothetical protein
MVTLRLSGRLDSGTRWPSSIPAVFRSEGAALARTKSEVERGTILNVDAVSSWDSLSTRYEIKRINHQEPYSDVT